MMTKGNRQGDSPSPILFSVVIDEIIKEVKHMRGFRMDKSVFTIICYVDDVMLTENEEDLQRLVYDFYKARLFNIKHHFNIT